jgi:hypothetical protein
MFTIKKFVVGIENPPTILGVNILGVESKGVAFKDLQLKGKPIKKVFEFYIAFSKPVDVFEKYVL